MYYMFAVFIYIYNVVLQLQPWKYFNFRLQEARLQVLEKILQQREDEHAEMTTKRLNKLW